jgi:hypothetical protein
MDENYDIEVYFTYSKEDTVFFSPDRIPELYNDLLKEEPSIDKSAAIDGIICELESELINEIMDTYDCVDRDSIELDSWTISDAVEEYVEEHWGETEHALEDSEGQLHLFDPNEYNE